MKHSNILSCFINSIHKLLENWYNFTKFKQEQVKGKYECMRQFRLLLLFYDNILYIGHEIYVK